MDKPARTLTCRNIAAATSDMHRIRLSDGRRRRLLQRETAILQSFPAWFQFEGNENSIFYQIGNAVPPMLAYHIAKSVKEYLSISSLKKNDVKALSRISRINQLELFGISEKKYSKKS